MGPSRYRRRCVGVNVSKRLYSRRAKRFTNNRPGGGEPVLRFDQVSVYRGDIVYAARNAFSIVRTYGFAAKTFWFRAIG